MMSCAGFGSFAHTDLSLLLKESVRLWSAGTTAGSEHVPYCVALRLHRQLYGEQILLFYIGGFFSSLD